jgi:hypothetical protein
MSNNSFLNTCFFDKVIPVNDIKQCTDHRSIGMFRQGIFDVSAMDINKYWKIDNFLNENSSIIDKIECYLLKHPLFDFPVEFYPFFMFVHHGQIGFKFLDKNGNTIRHMVLQLQNSHFPNLSNTKPFDLPTTCKVVNPENKDDNDIIIHLDDRTAIYADILEPKNGIHNNIIEMNKYTYFKGIELGILKKLVNFNFFLESYNLWREVNTNYKPIKPTENIDILKNTKIDCNQNNKLCGGDGDGSLFVFSGFSPAFLSQNEGCILHFATLSSQNNDSKNLTEQFKNFIKWNFSNLQCYSDRETHNDGFSKHYITLSPSSLNYNWALINNDKSAVDSLFSQLRPNNSKPAGWLNMKDWDQNDNDCKLFDQLMKNLENGNSIVQPKIVGEFNENSANIDNCPFLCHGDNYTCEIFTRFGVTMLLNNDTWSKNGINVDQHFDFTFNNIDENDMNFPENLFRAYSMYWPVAVFDDGYENGVPQSLFNSDSKYMKDKILYAKQTQLFKYIFNDDLIEASKTTNNPIIIVLAEFLGIPNLRNIISALTGKNKISAHLRSITTMLTSLLYAIFLHSFLGVDEVFVPGYPIRKFSENSFKYDYVKVYNCEPFIYKFQIGKASRAGIANNKCIEAYLNWLMKESPESVNEAVNINFGDDDITKQIKTDIINAINEFNAARTGRDEKDPDVECKSSINPFCKDIIKVNNDITQIKHIMNIGSDLVDAMLLMFHHPTKVPKLFLEVFYRYVQSTSSKILKILTLYMRKFTIICHQNYVFDPQIMIQTNPDFKTVYNFPDFIRPKDGICSTLKCNIDLTKNQSLALVNDSNNIEAKKFKAKYKLSNPYSIINKPNPNTAFYITLIICIILILLLFIVIGITLHKSYL